DAGLGTGSSVTVNFESQSVTRADINQVYAKIAGKAVVAQTETLGGTTSANGSASTEDTETTYCYNDFARLVDVHSSGKQDGTDAETKSRTVGNVVYTYMVKNGKALVASVTMITALTNVDGTVTNQEITTDYVYDSFGR